MKIILLINVLLFVGMIQSLKAQTAPPDSATKAALAKRDARFFRLDRKKLKAFKEQLFPATSDYFKPGPSRSIKPGLLTDSVYVQAYRKEAFFNVLDQRDQPGRPTLNSILMPPHPGAARFATDYNNLTQQQAQQDASKFRLDDKEIVQFKAQYYTNTSDYFKPTTKYTADTTRLKDSLYVRTFRNEAFDKARDQPENPKAHTFIIATIAVVSAVALVLIIGNTKGN